MPCYKLHELCPSRELYLIAPSLLLLEVALVLEGEVAGATWSQTAHLHTCLALETIATPLLVGVLVARLRSRSFVRRHVARLRRVITANNCCAEEARAQTTPQTRITLNFTAVTGAVMA